jgi:dihydropteroate synthase
MLLHAGHAFQLQLLHSLIAVRPASSFPLLVGTSRKGFISRILAHGQQQLQLRQAALSTAAVDSSSPSHNLAVNSPVAATSTVPSSLSAVSAEDREWGSGASVVASILAGADIVRVHDVHATRCLRDVADQIAKGKP